MLYLIALLLFAVAGNAMNGPAPLVALVPVVAGTVLFAIALDRSFTPHQ